MNNNDSVTSIHHTTDNRHASEIVGCTMYVSLMTKLHSLVEHGAETTNITKKQHLADCQLLCLDSMHSNCNQTGNSLNSKRTSDMVTVWQGNNDNTELEAFSISVTWLHD